ncbi:MAG: hypothetical protein L0207_05145 [Chlamydiae bacterium]|nr:hypothetical protein [Chlamydiota bacterium]
MPVKPLDLESGINQNPNPPAIIKSKLDSLVDLNSNSNYKIFKASIKLANRSLKTIQLMTGYDQLNLPYFVTKETRRAIFFIRSIVTLYTAKDKIKFLSISNTIEEYLKSFFQSFLFGRCEERRRLIKLGLSIVMIGSLTTHFFYQIGLLNKFFQNQEDGKRDRGLEIWIMTYAMVQTWQVCRRLLIIETTMHKWITSTPADSTKKKTKMNYSLAKSGLLILRYVGKFTNLTFLEKGSAISSALIAFEPAKKLFKPWNQEAQVKVKKSKDEKFNKVKASVDGWVGRIDKTTHTLITLFILSQLYYFMLLFFSPRFYKGQDR